MTDLTVMPTGITVFSMLWIPVEQRLDDDEHL